MYYLNTHNFNLNNNTYKPICHFPKSIQYSNIIIFVFEYKHENTKFKITNIELI